MILLRHHLAGTSLVLFASTLLVVLSSASDSNPTKGEDVASLVAAPASAGDRDSKQQQQPQRDRHLQDCGFAEHGYALECAFTTDGGNQVKYLVPCPANATSSADCLTDQSRLCYTYNSIPCVGSYYCNATGNLALDCSNIFAVSEGDTCSSTDCNLDCLSTADVPVDYNSVPLDNACFRSGFSEVLECTGDPERCTSTTEWFDILADSTEVRVTGRRDAASAVAPGFYDECTVEVVGGGACACSVDCAIPYDIGYDCSAYTNDVCAVTDCEGVCLNTGGGPPLPTEPLAPTAAPSDAPTAGPSSPSKSASVDPLLPTAAPSSSPVVGAPVEAPVDPPVEAPVDVPVDVPGPAPLSQPISWGPTTWGPPAPTAPTPTAIDLPADCQLNSACKALNLTGICCPGEGGKFLDCCYDGEPILPDEPVAECQLNSNCNALGLTGMCCPTMDDWILDCCDGVEKETTCELNEQCNALNLTGACCPTITGFGYLDCCDAFPVECIDGIDDDCNITAVEDFLEFMASGEPSAAMSNRGAGGTRFATSFSFIAFGVWYMFIL